MNSTDEMASRFTMNVDEGEQYVRANLGGKVKRTMGKLSFVREALAACRFIVPHVTGVYWAEPSPTWMPASHRPTLKRSIDDAVLIHALGDHILRAEIQT